jgi:hypothetical protein
MAVFGGITLLLQEANLEIKIDSVSGYQIVFQVINPLSGTIILLLVWGGLHVIGWATKGGLPVPLKTNGRLSDIAFNFGRVLAGVCLVIGMFFLLGQSSFVDRTLVEEIIRFASAVGLLSLILAPIFYGFGLLGRGVLELIDELRWRG